jgi:predicted nucleic acid-binding protein
MPTKVVDASALAAVLFGEPEAQFVAEKLGENSLVVPTLFRYEVANICWKKLRKHPEQREALLEAHSLLDQMGIEEADVSVSEVLLLADQENLTVYDASYLWLSQKLGIDLVTLDGDLRTASAKSSKSGEPERTTS